MSDDVTAAYLGIAALCVIIVMAFYLKLGVWSECRADHSFLYCLELVGHH